MRSPEIMGGLLVAVLSIGAPVPDNGADRPAVPALREGIYRIVSTVDEDRKADGACIVRKHGDAFVLHAISLGRAYNGVGVIEGRRFCVGWSFPNNGTPSVSIYEFHAGDKLVGKYPDGNGVIQVETLELLRAKE